MVKPEVVLSFLRFQDMGLALVMGGGVLVTLVGYKLVPRWLEAAPAGWPLPSPREPLEPRHPDRRGGVWHWLGPLRRLPRPRHRRPGHGQLEPAVGPGGHRAGAGLQGFLARACTARILAADHSQGNPCRALTHSASRHTSASPCCNTSKTSFQTLLQPDGPDLGGRNRPRTPAVHRRAAGGSHARRTHPGRRRSAARSCKPSKTRFHLSREEVDRLIELAQDTAKTAYDYQRFTGQLNEHFTQAQKIGVVEIHVDRGLRRCPPRRP